MKKIILLLILLIPFHMMADNFEEQTINKLSKLFTIRDKVKDIHPFLKNLYPVAVSRGDSLYIFSSAEESYKLEKVIPAPFKIPQGIRAAFPLAGYDNKPACVVTEDVFYNDEGYTIILHEFMHCAQFEGVENKIKMELQIMKTAMEKNNYSWELNHPFPYENKKFIEFYSQYVNALENDNINGAMNIKTILKGSLSKEDYEYLVWEEWKEGFARFIENKVKERMSINENTGGKGEPYNRVSFYYSGDKLIHLISLDNNKLLNNLEELFEYIKN